MTRFGRVVFALLVLDGAVVAIMGALFCTYAIGSVPVPLGALIAAFGNASLYLLARSNIVGAERWRFAPLWAWGAVTFAILVKGVMPGGDVVLPINDFRTYLLVLGGLTPLVADYLGRLNALGKTARA